MGVPAPDLPEQEPFLPALREDLRLMPGETLANGAPSWLLFDPLKNAYHRLDTLGYQRLAHWRAEPISAYLKRLNNLADAQTCEDELKELVKFLYTQKLTYAPAGEDSQTLATQEQAGKPSLSQLLIHKYLFFRIPLVRPDRFLRAVYPFISWIFTRPALQVVLACGLLGLYFTGRQWEEFTRTFMHFFTFEGLIYYGLTLAGLKILHELGHAFTAHHFGSRVPIMGIAFLVMFPILYTDTTNSWELTDRRKRVIIDAAGMLAELMIACLALLAWSFLPDGALRSAAFFAATTSWILSLIVNLNPMMRFDGYYLLSDLFGVPNMQSEGFSAGRWHMRETLFGLGETAPQSASSARRQGLIIYAYCTWVYRFFLFIGIALLVHALFPKAIGIILFTVEISWFIALPIFKELKQWWSLRMSILSSRRGRVTCGLTLALLAGLCVPWQQSIHAPALLRPALQTELYPVTSAKIARLYIAEGQSVKQGQVLAELSSEQIQTDLIAAKQRLALITAQLSRRNADRRDLTNSSTLLQSRLREQKAITGLEALASSLTIRAPHDGIINDMPSDLHTGRYIGGDYRLARLVSAERFEIIAFPKEEHAQRLSTATSAKFIADDITAPSLKVTVQSLAPTSLSTLTESTLSSQYKGPIAVEENADGQAVPTTARFQLTALPESAPQELQEYRGVLKIKAAPQSPMGSFVKSVSRVLIREADF